MTDTDLSNLTETRADLIDLGAALHDRRREYSADSAPDVLTALVPTGYQLVTALPSAAVAAQRSAPRRVCGEAIVTDTVSWLAYHEKYAGPQTEVFGDVNVGTVTAVLNAPHDAENAAWGDHRVTLKLEHSAAWNAWVKLNGQLVSQTAFAEHLENRTTDLRTPDAGTMLDLAQTLQTTNSVAFESGSQLHSGQRRFTYHETVEAKAGKRGDLDVPTQIEIEVQPWRGVALVVPMTARFRFRAGPAGLQLGYVLDQLEDMLDAAWSKLLSELNGTAEDEGAEPKLMILSGRAPQYGRE